MSKLVDTIDINVSVDNVWTWFSNISDNFTQWNPDHLWFEVLDETLEAGSRIRYCQRIGEVAYEMAGTIQRCEHNEAGFRIDIVYDSGLASTHFLCTATSLTSCRLTYAERFGVSDSALGKAFNFVALDLFSGARSASREMLDYMRRDNAYLKYILEEGVYPTDSVAYTTRTATIRRMPTSRMLMQATCASVLVAGALVGAFWLGAALNSNDDE